MKLEAKATLYDDESVREKLKVMSAWVTTMDDSRDKHDADWEAEVDKTLRLGKRYRVTLNIVEVLTCPFCGYDEIERPMIDVGEGLIEGLAECDICGAEEIDPAELDSEPNHKAGWRQAERVKTYDPTKHGALRDRAFAISCGPHWQAYTTAGRLVNLPADHPMVLRTKEYTEATESERPSR